MASIAQQCMQYLVISKLELINKYIYNLNIFWT